MRRTGWNVVVGGRWGALWATLGLALAVGCHEGGAGAVADAASDATLTGADGDDAAVAADAVDGDGAEPGDVAPADATAVDADAVPPDDGDDAVAPDGEVADVAPDVEPDVEADVEPDVEPDIEADVAPDVAEDVAPDVAPPTWTVVVNELDCRGTPSDWVEVVATGDTPVPLDLVFATDDASREDHWQALGVGTLAPGERLVVDLVRFGIACGSEGVALVGADGSVLDASPVGNDPVGTTYGRLPDTTGAFAITKPTRGLVNAAPDLDPFDPIGTLYDPTHAVPTIGITLDDVAWAQLAGDPYTWVAGTFTLTDDLGTVTQPVAVRLKGRLGSLRNLDGKAAFKLQFDRFWPGARFRGVKSLTLNNMVQDDAKIHELTAYAFFRAMGVPAPRAGYAWVRVNDQDFGLYVDLETYEDPFFADHFASTKAVFEGQYGDDLFPELAWRLDLDEGSEAGRLDLAALAAALQTTPPGEGFMAALAPLVDWDEVLAMMATEVFIGHWDGYAPTRNNFSIHVDDAGRVSLLPWGTDQTFGSDLGFYDGQGLLLQGCLGDPVCRVAWEDALLALAALVDSGAVTAPLHAVPPVIQPYVDIEPREGGGVDVAYGLQRAEEFLAYRAAALKDSVGCRRDPASDLDHDGAACDLDCNEGDETIHVGAVDVCGDGVDQDCNGRADDAPDCPDCSPATYGGRTYQFCWKGRTHDAAAAACAELGARLVVLEDMPEHDWVRDVGANAGVGALWIGLTDLAVEGVWTWDDGVPMEDRPTAWMGGEPNDWGGAEDCAELLTWAGDATWNDIGCEAELSVVCEPLGN